jgi:hypothetical protein
MWKTLYQSVQGTSHLHTGQPCQDSSALRQVVLADETVLVLACSDGAGSAEFSEIGSRTACSTLVDLVSAETRLAGRLGTVGSDRAREWLAQVHRAIGVQADLRDADARQLACTLLFAVLSQRGAAFGQIGDGAMVVWRDNAYQTVFWPQSGEYVNTTNFVSDRRWESFFEFAWCDQPVDEVALFSDGLQMLALDYHQQQVHGPFFAPLFASLRKQPEPADLMEPMRAFLESPQLAERTDDDKTLILATRLTS